MLSFIVAKKSPFSSLFPNKTPFSTTLCVLGCTCFVQDLSPGLDKLSPRSIKCVFVGYSRTQKGYRHYNASTRKYLVFADVTFFESVSYFSPLVYITISEAIPLSPTVLLPTPASTISSSLSPIKTQDPPATKSVRDFKYVCTHHLKVLVFKPVPAIPSLIDVLLHHQHLSLILIFPLPFEKVNGFTLIILFRTLFLMIILTSLFVSLSYHVF